MFGKIVLSVLLIAFPLICAEMIPHQLIYNRMDL